MVSFHMSGKTASARERLNRVASESDMEAPASFSNSCVTRSGPQLFPDGRCASFDNTESGVMVSNWNSTGPTRVRKMEWQLLMKRQNTALKTAHSE